MDVHLFEHMHADNHFWKSVLFSHHLGPRDYIRIPRLDKYTYLLSHLAIPINIILMMCVLVRVAIAVKRLHDQDNSHKGKI